MMTRRIFDGTLIIILAGHLAFGLPRMWARKEQMSGQRGVKRVAGQAILAATS